MWNKGAGVKAYVDIEIWLKHLLLQDGFDVNNEYLDVPNVIPVITVPRMPWCGPTAKDDDQEDSQEAPSSDVLSGLTKVKIAFFEVDPVTKTGKVCLSKIL